MNLPEVLDSGMKPVRILHPSECKPSLSIESISNAVLTVLLNEEIAYGDFVRLYYPNGKSGVFVASQPEYDYDAGTQTTKLMHTATTLKQSIVREGSSQGSDGKTVDKYYEGKPQVVLAKILGFQTTQHWKVGTVESTEDVKIKVDYDDCMTLIESMMEQLNGVYISYDQTKYPWSVNIVKYPTEVKAEGRLSRNVKKAKISYSDDDLCNVLICNRLNSDLRDSESIRKYGKREQYLYYDDSFKQEWVNKACRKYLENRKDPQVTVSIEGGDFSSLTGVPFDKIVLGDVYRLAIPQYNVVIEEQITELAYDDVYLHPYQCRITLGTHKKDLSSELAKTTQTAKKAGKASSKAKDDNNKAWVKIVGETTSLYSFIEQTETSIRTEVGNVEEGLKSQITQTASSIRAELENKTAGLETQIEVKAGEIVQLVEHKEAGLSTRIIQTANEIKTTARDLKEGFDSQISQTAKQISLKVSKGEVATSLEIEMNNVTVSNGNLVVEGMVTADAVATAFAAIQNVTANTINAGALNVASASGYTWEKVATQNYVYGTMYGLSLTDNGGGSYTLKWKLLGEEGSPDHTANFSRAVSLSGAWNGTTHTYTATAGASSVSTTVLLDYTSGTTNFAIHLCHDSTAQANRLISKSFFLVQDVSGKTVTCRADSSTGNVYGTISTAATYNSVTVEAVEFDTSTGSIITDDSERTNVYIRGVASNSATKSRLFRLVAPTTTVDGHYVVNLRQGSDIIGRIYADTAYNAVTVDTVSRSGATVTATASNGKTGTLTMSSYSNAVSSLTYITSATSSPTTTATTMYAYVNGTLTNMGSGFWYKRDGYMAPTTLYK